MRNIHTDNFQFQRGRVGQVEAKTITQSGGRADLKVTNFSLRVEQVRLDEDHLKLTGERKYVVYNGFWLRCEAFDRLAEQAARLEKGQMVGVFGETKATDDYTDGDGALQRNQTVCRVNGVWLDPSDLAGWQLNARRGRAEQREAETGEA